MACNFLRCPMVQKQTGMARSTLYAQVQRGLFPKPVKLGARIVGWPAHEIDEVSNARLAGYTDEQVRSLVSSLHTLRAEYPIAFSSGGRK